MKVSEVVRKLEDLIIMSQRHGLDIDIVNIDVHDTCLGVSYKKTIQASKQCICNSYEVYEEVTI